MSFQHDSGETLQCIAKNFHNFADKFPKVGNNYLQTPILNCNIFGYGPSMNAKFDNAFFNTVINSIEKFEKLTWDTLATNNELKSKGEIELRIGCNLSNAQYPNLKSGYKIALKKYHKEGEKTVTLENFVLNTT